jgi:hypothetical protein
MRVLSPGLNTSGYLHLKIGMGSRATAVQRTVHRLVCLAWHGPSDLPIVRHLNDNRTDNRPDNLAWGTQRDNMRDYLDNRGHYRGKLSHCKRGHEFTPENTYKRSDRPNVRNCRKCRQLATDRYKSKEKES